MPIALNGNGPITGATTVNGLTVPSDSLSPGLVLVASQSFSAVSSISVNNCFSSTYGNYLVLINALNGSTSNMSLRLRLAGTDAATSYNRQDMNANSTTLSAARASNATDFILGNVGPEGCSTSLTVFRPGEASETRFIGQHVYNGGWTVPFIQLEFGNHAVSTAYDGFSLIWSAGSGTGTIRVYGLRGN